VLVGFSSKFEIGRVPTCCGNCRDIMRDSFPTSALIFSGAPNGGKVVLARLTDLLVDDYEITDEKEIDGNRPLSSKVKTAIINAICAGRKLENDIYSPREPHPRRRYYASIDNGLDYYCGAHDVMCDYHPIYALRDAVRQARRENKPQFEYAVVACRDDGTGLPPDVMYKDRQHLLELNFQQECLVGGKVDPAVYLVTFQEINSSRNFEITKFWRTTVKTWLPYPFTPSAFGQDFIDYATQKFKGK